MKCVFFTCLLFHLNQVVVAQNPEWQNSRKWRLYAIEGNKGLNLRVDSLINYKFVDMDDDSVHNFFEGLIAWPKEQSAMWMGAYYASCLIEGRLHKVNFSTHGAYFYDEQLHAYFQIAAEKREEFEGWVLSIKRRLKSKY